MREKLVFDEMVTAAMDGFQAYVAIESAFFLK
jgi:hypothetical protein